MTLYLGIGFVPYNAFRFVEGRGIFVPAAYPRLWFMSALFFIALAAAASVGKAGNEFREADF